MKPTISYLVTCKNEGKQLKELLDLLSKHMTIVNSNSNVIGVNECVIVDDFSDDIETVGILEEAKTKQDFKVCQHKLNGDYGSHKNYGIEQCSGFWIFQIDSDELPSVTLLNNLADILQLNAKIELLWLPRVNNFQGVTEIHAKQWGWNIDNPHKWVNWSTGDYQTRIFRNLPHIRWKGRLHERISGNKTYAFLPKEEDFALYHNKSIEKQLETNARYNSEFTEQDNKGIH